MPLENDGTPLIVLQKQFITYLNARCHSFLSLITLENLCYLGFIQKILTNVKKTFLESKTIVSVKKITENNELLFIYNPIRYSDFHQQL